MISLVSKLYDWLLMAVAAYFCFNVFVRDQFLNWIYGTSSDRSVTDAQAYAQETLVRNRFSKVLLVALVLLFIASIILLFSKQERKEKGILLVGVAVFIAFCFFLGLISGNLS